MKKLFLAISLYFISTISFCNSQVFPAILRQWAGYAGNTDSTFKTPVITKESYTYVAATVVDSLTGANIDLVKYDTEGKIVWTYSWTGSGYGRDQASDIVYGNDSLIYVCGTTHTAANDFDFLVLCVTSQGNLKWSRTYNGTASQYDVATSMDVRDTIVYVTGVTYNTGSFLDYHTICYDWNGNLIWQNDFDYNSLMDIPFQLTTSAEGVFVTGGSQNSLQDWDYQTVKYDFDGTLLGQDRVSGSAAGFDRAQAVTSDDSGYIYITGGTMGNDFDINTAKFGKYGNLIWTNKLDYGGNDIACDVVTDTLGNVYICGSSDSVGTGMDFFVARLDPATGNEIWSRHIDGYFTNDSARAMCIDAFNNVVITGQVFEKYANAYDFYTVAFDSLGSIVWKDQFDGPDHLNDNATNIASDANGNIFVTGQVAANSEIQTVTIKYRTDYFIQPPAVDTPSAAYLFYPNRGQLIDENNNDITDIAHYYTLHHYPQLYFGYGVMNMVFNHIDEDTTTADTLQRVDVSFLNSTNPTKAYPVFENKSYLNYYLAQCPNGITNVYGYENLVYTDVWDDIDVIYSSDNAGLKMTFVCNPGSSPQEIGLLFQGQDGLVIDQNWFLQVQTAIGNYSFAKPRVYQLDGLGNRIQLNWQLSWDVNSNEATFSGWGSYDTSKPLIIEINKTINVATTQGNILWSTYCGSTYNDEASQTITDDNNFYTVALSKNSFFPGVNGLSIQVLNHGQSDLAITAFADAGNQSTHTNILWSTFYGGSQSEIPGGIAINKTTKDLFIIGNTLSSNFPVFPTSSNFNQTYSGSKDGFLVRINAAGNQVLYATYIGGSEWDEALTIAINQNDQSVYVGGQTESTPASTIVFPLTTSSQSSSYNQSNFAGDSNSGLGFGDGFILRFSNTPLGGGNYRNDILWSTYFGGNLGDRIKSLEILDDGKLVVAGATESNSASTSTTSPCIANSNSDFPVCDPGGTRFFDNSYNGLLDCFISIFNSTDQLLWCSYLGGSGNDQVNETHSISTTYSPSQIFYVAGTTGSPSDFPVNGTTGYHQVFGGGPTDAFVAKFKTYDKEQCTFFGGAHEDIGNSVAVDINNNAYVCGTTESYSSTNSCTPLTTGEFPLCNSTGTLYSNLYVTGSGQSMYLCAFDSWNDLFWSTYIGGLSNAEWGTSIAASTNRLYLYGTSASDNPDPYPYYNLTDYYYQPQNAGGAGWLEPVITQFNIGNLVGTNEINNSEFISAVYPNPTTGKVFIKINESIKLNKNVSISIRDIQNRLLNLKKGEFTIAENNSLSFDISSLASGIYFCALTSDDKIINCKIIKQ